MTVIDLVLLVVLLMALAAGLSRGLLATLGGLIGLILGGLAAFWAVPAINDALPSSEWRGPVSIAVAILLPLAGASLGAGLGRDLRQGVDRTSLRPLERLLGGVANVVVAALALSFVGNAVSATGTPGVASAVSSSAVLRTIEDLTPPTVGRPLAQMRAMVLDDGLPRLNILIVPRQDPVAPAVDLDNDQLEASAQSVARISGIAYACGKSSTGSGFRRGARPAGDECARRGGGGPAGCGAARQVGTGGAGRATSTPWTTSPSSPSRGWMRTRSGWHGHSRWATAPWSWAIRTAGRSRP